MKIVNKDTDYAIKALLEIAGRGGRVVSVSALAGTVGLPRPYLRKIMQELARAGIVVSTRGKGGGFVLARPASAVRLADVLRVFQGPVKIHDCVFKTGVCPDVRTCPLRLALGRLESKLAAELEALTLAGLLADRAGDHKKPGPSRKKGGTT